MKKYLLLALLCVAPCANAQIGQIQNPVNGILNVQDAGTCSTPNSFVIQQLPVGAATTTVNVAGTFSATVTIRESNNGGATWTSAGTVSAAGTTTYQTSGFSHVCVDVTTYVSGNVLVSVSTGILQMSSAPGIPFVNAVQSVIGGVLRAVTYKDSSGNVLGVDLYPDATITDQGASGVTGNFFWALAQIPTSGGFIHPHTGTFTFLTSVTDTTHNNLNIACDDWGTVLAEGATLSGTELFYVGAGTSTNHNWTITNCAITGNADAHLALHFGAGTYGHIVKNNFISGWHGLYGGIDFSNAYNSLADGNYIVDVTDGVALSGTNTQYGNRVVNNYIFNTIGPGVQGDDPWNDIISNNHLVNAGSNGGNTNSAIRVAGSFSVISGIIITGNSITSPGLYCMELNNSPAGFQSIQYAVISGNTCSGSTTNSIWIGTGEDYNIISGNVTSLPIVTSGAHDQIYGGNNFGSTASGAGQLQSACETAFAATTLATGATTTNTGLNCLPANAIIDAVAYRITTTITTAANFTIGDATIAARFCATQSTLTAGTTGICFAQADQTGTSGPRQVSAAAVRVTTNVNPGAGAMRLIVYYHTWTAPTS